MPDFAATTAYQLLSDGKLRRNWLSKSPAQLQAETYERQQFWLVFSAPNATLRPNIFRLPSRDYPFLVTGATINRAATSLKIYSTDDQLTSYFVPTAAIAGGSDSERTIFHWPEPVLLLPHTIWRGEMVLTDNTALPLTTYIIFHGVKLNRRK